MNRKYEQLRAKAFSALQQLAAQDPDFDQARMLIGAAETEASLKQRTVRKSVDTEWIDRIEAALPALDLIVRQPTVTIEDEEEIVPVELTRRISEKSIKHLSQHTNLILKIEGDEITPSRILNVFHEESYLTYENKFINTLLVRLAAFVDKRYQALVGGAGVEKDFAFEYGVEFDHLSQEEKRSAAKVKLQIELSAPLGDAENEADTDLNAQFTAAIERIRKIHLAITAYLSSPFAQKLGRNFIRPPVIRTNAILKNKNFKDCLTLWEYIEGYDKPGFSVLGDEFAQIPSDEFVSDLYGLLALQYTQFYHGVVGDDTKVLAQRQLPEIMPDFAPDVTEEDLDDYLVYDAEYRKIVPVSRLMNNRKKLSDDERLIREAIEVALRADELVNAELLAAEEEARRLERERLQAEAAERARKAAMEAAARRGPIEVGYQRSFLSRYIQAGEPTQGFYTAIKNELLAYERVSARISWKCETYRQGKRTLARINVRGKALALYLALSPEEYANKKGLADAGKKMADTQLLIKVKSEQACKRALALIREMMKKQEIARIERENEDFRMPYEDTEALVERGLIKRILPDGITPNEFDELVSVNIAARIGARKAANGAEQSAAEEAEEAAQALAVAAAPVQINAAYRRSFLSRYIQAGEELQARYTLLKNRLLSYKRVSARTSWKGETYRQGKRVLARVNVKGKTLYLYLALTPDTTQAIRTENNASTPLLLKIKSDRACKRALALLDVMLGELGAVRKANYIPQDFAMPYEDTEALVARGLIKPLAPAADGALPEEQAPILEESPETVSENEPSAPTVADAEPAPEEETLPETEASQEEEALPAEETLPPEEAFTTESLAPMEETPMATWARAERVAVDLTQIDFNDAEFLHEITDDIVDEFGLSLQAVVVECKELVGRTCMRLEIASIPRSVRKKTRPHPKNFIFVGESKPIGLPVPYTKKEYAGLCASEKKLVLSHVTRLQAYDVTRAQLALLRVLKTDDLKVIERFKRLEVRLAMQTEELPQSPRWKELIKE